MEFIILFSALFSKFERLFVFKFGRPEAEELRLKVFYERDKI